MSTDANYVELLKNDEWEVLTPEGYQPFFGLSKSNKTTMKILFDDGSNIVCTEDHQIFFSDVEKKTSISFDVGDIIKTVKYDKRVKQIISDNGVCDVYDLINVGIKHRFIANDITVSNCVFLDEAAFVSDYIWEDFYNSVLPSISGGKTSKIIMVSTPKGMNHFYKIYKDAADDRTNFKAIKVPWWERPDRDSEWKAERMKEMEIQQFNQEYACKFLGSSSTLIDPDVLERTNMESPIDNKYNGAMLIYEYPQPNAFYILGVDSAKGNGSDYSTIQVLKVTSEHDISQVAMYRNNLIGPDEFAQLAIGVSSYYNNAYMMVESNDIGELVVHKMWYDYECDRILNCDAKGLGIRATRKSKLAGNLLLKRYMENGWLDIKDRRTIYELSRYEEVSPNVFHAAGQNEHDDCVTSLIWGLYYLTTVFYDKDSNSLSDVKNIDSKYRIDNDDTPVFVTPDEDENFRWEIY